MFKNEPAEYHKLKDQNNGNTFQETA